MVRETNSRWLSRFFNNETVGVSRFSRICKIFDSPNVSNDGGEVVLGEMNVSVSLRGDEVARWFDLTEMGVERIVHIPFAI